MSLQKMPLSKAADKSGMSEKTARKYRKSGLSPNESKKAHEWRTRKDPFEGVWPEIEEMLKENPGLSATSLMEYLSEHKTYKSNEKQLRTLQRRIRVWRATEGPNKEVMFSQEHRPGEVGESDFTDMNEIGITIGGAWFCHKLYHFVLTYSNWEWATICFSESFESLGEGLQASLWELGGVPVYHRTDQMSSSVQKVENRKEFTDRYTSLLNHYRLTGQKIQVCRPNENGDIEQRHHRLKQAVRQKLMLRGSQDFESKEAYEIFLKAILVSLNQKRETRLKEEMGHLRSLPLAKLDTAKSLSVRVRSSSTIAVDRNIYSVNSRLIGEVVEVKILSGHIEIWFAQKKRDSFPRLSGRGKYRIHYRHIIESLVRKPGAFGQYRYREELFPSSRFRAAYDWLIQHHPATGHKDYLKILYLAATESEQKVDESIQWLFDQSLPINGEFVQDLVKNTASLPRIDHVEIQAVHIAQYDALLPEVALCL